MDKNKPLYEKCVFLLNNGLGDQDRFVRLRAVFLCGETANPVFAGRLEKILLEDRSVSIRARCAEALGKIADQSSAVALNTALSLKQDAFTRACCFEALGKIGERAFLGIIRSGLEDKAEMVRVACLQAIRQLGERAELSGLVFALSFRDPQARRWACDALADSAEEAILPQLKIMADKDRDSLVRIWAARAAVLIHKASGKVYPRDYFFVFSSLAKSRDPGVRSRVACALGDIADELSPSLLEEILRKDKDTLPRIWAAEALGKLGKNSLPCLMDIAKNDPDPIVRAWSAEAMGKLGQQDSALELAVVLLEVRDHVLRLHAAKSALALIR